MPRQDSHLLVINYQYIRRHKQSTINNYIIVDMSYYHTILYVFGRLPSKTESILRLDRAIDQEKYTDTRRIRFFKTQ